MMPSLREDLAESIDVLLTRLERYAQQSGEPTWDEHVVRLERHRDRLRENAAKERKAEAAAYARNQP